MQTALVNRLRIGTGTEKHPNETPLQSSTKLTRNICNTAFALISFKKRKFTLVLFIIPTLTFVKQLPLSVPDTAAFSGNQKARHACPCLIDQR